MILGSDLLLGPVVDLACYLGLACRSRCLGSCLGLVNGRAGSGPGTHNAPLFPAEEVGLSQLEKKNVYDWLGVGNSGLLMLVCSNVRITGAFSIFGVTFDVVVWDSLKLEVSIKGLQSGGFLCVTGYCWFFSREIWFCFVGHYQSQTFLIAAWKRLVKGAWM